MKVGILDSVSHATRGGAYTFHNEIIHSLVQYANTSNHHFVIFSSDTARFQNLSLPSKIEIVNLLGNLSFSKLTPFMHMLIKKLGSRFRDLPLVMDYFKLKHKELIKNEIDIVWSMDGFNFTYDIPFMTTVWDLQHRVQAFFPEVSSKGAWQKRENTYTTILRRAAYIIVGTECGKSEIMQFYQVPSERIKVLPMPTPQSSLNHFAKEISLSDKFNGPEPYLFYPAQFWPHKNHVTLLHAVKILREKYGLNFRLFLAGSDKGNKNYLEHLVKDLELTNQVNFLGFVSEQEKIALYKHAFALTFPTFFGPDNIPPLEAFALGCPVIASRVDGAEEQLGNAALFFDPKEPAELVDAIKMLYEKSNMRDELIQRGRERAILFTGKEYVEGIFTILDEFEPFRRCWSNKE
jgi:glycosyltransferase involved in cell wall biosynthesis